MVVALALAVAVLLLGPLAVFAFGDLTPGSSWRVASRAPLGLAPDPAVDREPIVQVYGARTLGWRGAFAIHTWIATKRADADDWRSHHVIGWRVWRGGSGVVSQTGAPDFSWFGARPQLLAERRGTEVEGTIDRIEAAVEDWPYARSYRAWPGPNSNTFTAFVARAVPELELDLPANAIGKDFLGGARVLDRLPSGTGWQVSLLGLAGLSIGRTEGIEANLLGLSFGIDPGDRALRLPGIGRWPAASGAVAAP